VKRRPHRQFTGAIVRDGQRIDRALLSSIEQGLDVDGCALLIGPYEVGKSDLAREIAKRFGDGAHYLNGNNRRDRNRFREEVGLLRRSADQLVILDEIHGFPGGLDLIRTELEAVRREHRPRRRFLILGSMPTEAKRLASERLGTRARTYRLSPIGLAELPDEHVHFGDARTFLPGEVEAIVPIARSNSTITMQTLWMRGGFPLSLFAGDDVASFAWRERYIDSLCERGYRHISQSLSASTVHEILARVAATQGEPFKVDRSRLEQKACLDYLDDLGLIRHLRPWSVNELKRLEKNPKVYIRDTGLLHCLLNRRTHDELRGDGKVLGHSWEGFCIENLIAAVPHARAFYYRSGDEQDEIDLVLEFSADRRVAIEIKSQTAKLGKGFERALDVVKPIGAYVVRPVPESSDNGSHRVMTLSDMINIMRATPR
jgi:predicted AAA+ superfamily ATPase